eukprot:3041003-Ditylum_brightwellii.AAC.1
MLTERAAYGYMQGAITVVVRMQSKLDRMEMGMVLATAEMLKNDDVRQTGETTGANYNEAISALKE